jgi:hypothetical protein
LPQHVRYTNNIVIYFSCAYTLHEVLQLEYPSRQPQRSKPKREAIAFLAPVETVGEKASVLNITVVKTRHIYRESNPMQFADIILHWKESQSSDIYHSSTPAVPTYKLVYQGSLGADNFCCRLGFRNIIRSPKLCLCCILFIVSRFEESELATKHCRYVIPTERKLHPMFDDEMKTSFGNGKTATATANSWRTVQRNKQSARDMMSWKTTEDNQGGGNQRDSLCLQKGYPDVRFMFATKSPAASATFNLARSMKDFIIAGRQFDENFCILPL